MKVTPLIKLGEMRKEVTQRKVHKKYQLLLKSFLVIITVMSPLTTLWAKMDVTKGGGPRSL